MASNTLTFVECRYADAVFSGKKWVGTVSGYDQGYFGCIYSFEPSVRAKSITFSLSYTAWGFEKTIYYKVSSSPTYNKGSVGSQSFTSPGNGGNPDAGASATQTITVTGEFEAGTTYYLFLQSTTTGNTGYMENTSGSITYTPAAPSVYVKVSGEWKPAKAVYVKAGGEWKEAKEVQTRVSGEWKPADK